MQASLVMFKSDGERRDFPLEKSVTVIGRRQGCELRIPLSSVSRQHCQVEIDDDELYIVDLGSSNGTFHNDQRVQRAKLEAGDTLVIGPVHFTVVIDGEPAEIEPVKTFVEGGGEVTSRARSSASAAPTAIKTGAEPSDHKKTDVPDEDEATMDAPTVSMPKDDAADDDDPIAALERLARSESKSKKSPADALDKLAGLNDDDIASLLNADDEEDED